VRFPICLKIKFGLRLDIRSNLVDQTEFWTDLEDKNACRYLKNLCKLGLIPMGLRTKSDLFCQVTQWRHSVPPFRIKSINYTDPSPSPLAGNRIKSLHISRQRHTREMSTCSVAIHLAPKNRGFGSCWFWEKLRFRF